MVEASQKLRELLQPSLARWAGILGDFDGNIESDRPNEVYVRLRQAGSTSYVVGSFKVRGALRLWLNLPVWVALDPVTGEQYIDGADTDMMAYSSATQDAGMATLPLHAPSHDWRPTADDQLQWLHTLQFYSLRVQPGSTTGHVDVQKGIYFAGGELVFKSAATDLDLTSYYPASGSALVKICIDKDDNITVIQGAAGSDATLFSQLEATPADNYALAAVRLTFGAEILWAQADGGDIYDLRFVNEITTTVFGGGEVVIAGGVVKAGFNIDSIDPSRWVEMGDMVIPTPYCGLVTDETVVGFSALWDGSYLRLYMKETAAVPAGYLAFSDNQDLLIGACDSLGFTTLIEIDGAGVNFMQFNPAYVAAGHSEGRVHWNPNEYTLDIETGLGPILQMGQEMYILIYNDTGFQIDNLTVLRPKGATIVSGEVIVTVEKAIADTFEGCEGTIMIATMDIPDSTVGLATRFGRARGGNTVGFTPGAAIFLSDTVAGEFTETRPEFPSYDISLGGVLKADALEGEIIVSVTRDIFDTTLNFWNGVVRETIDFLITSDGATVMGTLTAATGADNLTLIYSDGYFLLDVSPALTIALTAGTDDIPQINYVYIPNSTKVLTVSTSDWPTTEHAKIATVVLQSAAATQSDGALRNQNWNDHIADADDFMGHLSDIGERIRQDAAKWDAGVEGSVTIDTGPTPDDVWAKVTGGVVYQLHRQTFPILDMTQYGIDAVSTGSKTFTISGDGDLSSTFPDGREIKVNGSTGNDGRYTIVSTLWSDPDFIITVDEAIPSAVADGTIGDDIHIVNDFANPYTTILNFNQITSDALGVSLTNSSFSVVLWGVQNKNGETCHLMLNLPTDSYGRLRPDDAVNDANNYSVYTIPKTFQGAGFLIARFTLTLTASGNDWTLYATEDLRGFTPNTAAGGGAGGVGVTTFLALTDTPSAYTGLGSRIVNVNAGATALEFAAGMFWDSAGSRAGVGIAPTDGTLHVHTATAGAVTAPTDFDDLVIENSANTGATFLAPDANTAGIAFGSPSDNYGAFVSWGYDSDLMTIGTNKAGAEIAFYTALTAEAMRIDASGFVGISETSPDVALHLSNIVTEGGIKIEGAAGSTTVVMRLLNNNTGGKEWRLKSTGGGAGIGQGKFLLTNATDTINALVATSSGRVGIPVSSPLAQLHVDQSSGSGTIPVLVLDQGNISEQCIKVSSDGVDRDIHILTVDVTGTPTWDWNELNSAFAYSHDINMVGNARNIYFGRAGGTGPLGFDFANGELIVGYRTTPDTLAFENSSNQELLGVNVSAGEVVVNEDSLAEIDFRVESNGQTHMFFVDGVNDRVGVTASVPSTRLDIGGGALTMAEMTAPSAPAANGVVIYAEDNGAGKTRLMALFASGVAQQLAIQP